ncbi:MAG: SdrD B-like domain-containing protein, partial [Actinomycetes bacterium]
MRSRLTVFTTAILVAFVILGVGATSALAAPVNDNFVDAISLTPVSVGTIAGNNSGATKETNEVIYTWPDGSKDVASIWYTWTALTDDIVSFDTSGSVNQTEVRAYRGSAVSALVEAPESAFLYDIPNRGHVAFPAKAGWTYRIAITSPAGAPQGNTVLNWKTMGNLSHITGTVTSSFDSGALSGIQVDAYPVSGSGTSWRTVTTNVSGFYDLTGLAAGPYKIRFQDNAGAYLTEWSTDKISDTAADLITITANGDTVANNNASLDRVTNLSGTVRNNGVGLGPVTVQLLEYTNGSLNLNSPSTTTDGSGGYSFSALRPKVGVGNYYLVHFVEPFGSGLTEQYYNQQTVKELATQFRPTIAGTPFTSIDCVWPQDVTPPTTTIASNPATSTAIGGWIKGPVSVSYTASDGTGGGVASTWSSIDGTPAVTFPNPTVIAKNGTTDFKYFSV